MRSHHARFGDRVGGAWLYVESGQGEPSTDASFGIRATFYSGSDWTGQSSPFGILNWTVTDQWHFRSLAAVVEGAQSVRAELVLRKVAAGGSFTGFMDDIQVIPEPPHGVLNGAALLALAVIPRFGASRRRPLSTSPRRG